MHPIRMKSDYEMHVTRSAILSISGVCVCTYIW